MEGLSEGGRKKGGTKTAKQMEGLSEGGRKKGGTKTAKHKNK
jgi:hypothetical protein